MDLVEPRLVAYYRLCAIKRFEDATIPLVAQIDRRAVEIIFTAKTAEMFFTEKNEALKIKETVIGAREQPSRGEPQKILVF